MKGNLLIDRRDFLKFTGIASTGLILGLGLHSCHSDNENETGFNPNFFIHIPSSGPIEIVCHRSEMGQGIRTCLMQMMADELDVSLDLIKVIQAKGDKKYGDQNTDGSKSIRLNWSRLREMAAKARAILIHSASDEWKVPVKECKSLEGEVIHQKSGRKKTYQELSLKAKNINKDVPFRVKNPKEYRYIGKGISGIDIPSYVSGKAIYGMDIDIENMIHVSLKRSPIPGGKIKKINDEKALKVYGVNQIIKLDSILQDVNTSESVGVVATNTWAALEGCRELDVDWDLTHLKLMNDKKMRDALEEGVQRKSPGKVYRLEKGKEKTEEKSSYSFNFYTPLLAHATMEPLVATASVNKDGCEVWAPTQHPQRAQKAIAKYLKIPIEKVIVNVTFLGGGFGRKSQPDFILEAVVAAAKLKRPVKLTWSREDEIQNGFFHPCAKQRIDVGLDEENRLIRWKHRSVFPSIMSVFLPEPKVPADWEMALGATTLPYQIPQIEVEGTHIDVPVRRGWLRSVNNIYHSFAISTVVDELSRKLKKDPIDYSLEIIGKDRVVGKQDIARLRHVIEEVRVQSDWTKKIKAGKTLGFAHHYSFGSYLAFVVEVEKREGEKWPVVKDVFCVLDCGQYVNIDIVKSQMEGSVAFGLSIAYYGKIEIDLNGVKQSNFDDYEVIRIDEMPKVNVHVMDNSHPPEGVGEPGVPAFIGALTNAFSRSTGKEIRELPLKNV